MEPAQRGEQAIVAVIRTAVVRARWILGPFAVGALALAIVGATAGEWWLVAVGAMPLFVMPVLFRRVSSHPVLRALRARRIVAIELSPAVVPATSQARIPGHDWLVSFRMTDGSTQRSALFKLRAPELRGFVDAVAELVPAPAITGVGASADAADFIASPAGTATPLALPHAYAFDAAGSAHRPMARTRRALRARGAVIMAGSLAATALGLVLVWLQRGGGNAYVGGVCVVGWIGVALGLFQLLTGRDQPRGLLAAVRVVFVVAIALIGSVLGFAVAGI
jgi:hypothetical protein